MHPFITAHKAELDYWPGVTHRYQMRGKHQAIVLAFNGASQFVMFPKTPSDSMRGLHNHLRDLRQTLKALGAKRQKISRRAQQLSAKIVAKHPPEPATTIVLPPREHGRSPESDPWTTLQQIRAWTQTPVNLDGVFSRPVLQAANPSQQLGQLPSPIWLGKETVEIDPTQLISAPPQQASAIQSYLKDPPQQTQLAGIPPEILQQANLGASGIGELLQQAANENIMAHPGRTVAEDTRPWDWPATPKSRQDAPSLTAYVTVVAIAVTVGIVLGFATGLLNG